MAKAKENKVEVTLDDGQTIEMYASDEAKIQEADVSVLAEGWRAASPIHFGVSLGFMDCVANQLPEFVMGSLKGIPVLNPRELAHDILKTYIETKGLKIDAKMASSKSGAAKKVSQINQIAESSPELKAALIAAGYKF